MSLLAPLIGGAFGVIVGLSATPNAQVAVILGAFCALLGWALTGFSTGSRHQRESESRHKQGPPKPEPKTLSEPTVAERSPTLPAAATTPQDSRGERQWFWFKVKATLIIGVVIVAFNYKRCTETPEERYQRDQYMSERIKSISSQEAYDECMSEGEGGSECREAAQRARELAEKKASAILGK